MKQKQIISPPGGAILVIENWSKMLFLYFNLVGPPGGEI